MRLDLLFAHCADLGVQVDWADLGEYRRGEYRADEHRIVLNHRLTRAQAAATCAHEVAHHLFGDRCSSPVAERRAWEYGAALIITPREYAAAEAAVGPHLGALADELGVTPKLVEAWRRWFSRKRHAYAGWIPRVVGDVADGIEVDHLVAEGDGDELAPSG
jgi:hypothetical protein